MKIKFSKVAYVNIYRQYVCAYVCVYTHICRCTHTHMYIGTRTHIHTYAYTHICAHIVYICSHVYVYTHLFAHTQYDKFRFSTYLTYIFLFIFPFEMMKVFKTRKVKKSVLKKIAINSVKKKIVLNK